MGPVDVEMDDIRQPSSSKSVRTLNYNIADDAWQSDNPFKPTRRLNHRSDTSFEFDQESASHGGSTIHHLNMLTVTDQNPDANIGITQDADWISVLTAEVWSTCITWPAIP